MPQNKLFQAGYAIGRLPLVILGSSVPSFIPFIYSDKFGLSHSNFGISWAVFCVVSAFSGLFWGFVVDNTRTRYGSYLPYAFAWIIPALFVGKFAWIPPDYVLADQDLLFWYFTASLTVFGSAISLGNVSYKSLGLELFPEERDFVDRLDKIFFLGGIIFSQSPPLIAGLDWSAPGRDYLGTLITSISAGAQAITLFACIQAYGNLTDKQKKEQQNKPKTPLSGLLSPTFKVLGNSTLCRSCFAFSISLFGLNTSGAAVAHYMKYVADLGSDYTDPLMGIVVTVQTQIAILQLLAITVALLVAPFVVALVSSRGLKFVWAASGISSGLIWVALVSVFTSRLFGLEFIISLFFGVVLSCFLILPDMAVGDAIAFQEEASPKTFPGKGAVLGAVVFIANIINAINAPIQNNILTYFGYTQPTAQNPKPEQSESAKFAIVSLFYLAPAITSLVAAALMPSFPKKKASPKVKTS